MEDLTFRMYQSPDQDRIYQLWKQEFESPYIEKRKSVFSWLVEENPCLRGGPAPYHIVECSGEVVGYYGKMPLKFTVKGEIINAYFSHDILLNLKYWGKGVADKLTKELKTRSKSFVAALWLNQSNYRLHTRCGWLDIKGCYPYRKIYNVDGFIKNKLTNKFITKLLTPIINYVLLVDRLLASVNIDQRFKKEVNLSFDKRFDIFADRISKCFGIMVFRDARYLIWKYSRRPYVAYQVISVTQNERIVGYVIFRVRDTGQMREGIILDIICEPDQTAVFKYLIREAEKYLRKERVDYITCLVTYPAFRRALRKCGFVRSRHVEPFMVTNYEKYFSKEYAEKIENWYLTLGDSDGDVWEVN